MPPTDSVESNEMHAPPENFRFRGAHGVFYFIFSAVLAALFVAREVALLFSRGVRRCTFYK